ncbi:MAG: 2TM domain-containing protein [Chitinophagaceae bacterium]
MNYQSNWGTQTPVEPKKGFRIHLLVFVLTNLVIWIVWYFTDRTYPWPLWSTPAWALGLLIHYLCVYVFHKVKATKPQ